MHTDRSEPSRSSFQTSMDTTQIPQTFVRSVKPTDVCFDSIDSVLNAVHTGPSPAWVIVSFGEHHQSRTNNLRIIASGDDDLSDPSIWPSELFAGNTLCYGLIRIDFHDDERAPGFVSFCWKGRNLPVYLRTKYTEFNHVIRKHLRGSTHVALQNASELIDGSAWKQMAPTPRRKRSGSRRFITQEIEFPPSLVQAVKDIRSDGAPFNWMVCGYDINDNGGQQLVVVEKGMNGVYGLKGLGGIPAALKEGRTMYLYLRVDIPLHHAERIVSKYVLVTWQVDSDIGLYGDEDTFPEVWDLSPVYADSGTPPSLRDSLVSNSNSRVQRVVAAHVHGQEVYRFFPHHVHFCANSLEEITEESIRERVRRAVDNDCMLLRVVCIQHSGDTQPPVCIEVPFDATVSQLRKEIATFVGIPENRQRIVWIRQTDEFLHELQRSTKAILFDNDQALLRKDIGLGHGDKIHVDDNVTGESSILEKLVQQINSGIVSVSLSAERRHEVQKGVEAREAELQQILSETHDQLRRRASRDMRSIADLVHTPPQSATGDVSSHQSSEQPDYSQRRPSITASDLRSIQLKTAISSDDSNRTIPTAQEQEDVSNLQEQARVLEAQNEYLEIPYESIRILGGKENELGCGKAATVYRGLWMNKNVAAEVAIKSFRYARLTDKIRSDYTKEVALLRKLKHPNIVLFIGACTSPQLLILTEYCSRKSLYEVIHHESFSSIAFKFKVRMMLDAARGIQYLHSKRIIHRDIKSHNFLVDDDWRVKVADFGISKVLENDGNAFTQCGTTGWVAPEVMLDEDLGYTFKADNWSFAIVMWEVIANGLPNLFIGMAPVKFYNQSITAGVRPPCPEDTDPEYVALINDCWASLPDDRPSFTDIVVRLEQMVLKLGASIDLPPVYQGGFHYVAEVEKNT